MGSHSGPPLFSLFWRVPVFAAFVICAVTLSHATNYYADCSLSSSANDGLSPATAWNSVAAVNAHAFLPGDVLAFKRGTSCSGSLQPRGSGTATAPVRLTAYGSGARPILQSTAEEVIKIYNQEYWEIDSLETSGGFRFGIWIDADVPSRIFHHFRITNVYVHDVMGPARWDGGSVVVIPTGQGTTLDDVVIDSVTVANSNQWYGIHVGFNFMIGYGTAYPFSTNITIRNSQVSNVYGDGITTAQAQNVLIDHNLVHDVGLAPPGISYTPNAIWSWSSDHTTVQYNEGYHSHSYNPAQDGGIFDIDWGSSNTTIQDNYAHDADGYCVSVFGGQGVTTSNSVVRYNICSHNQLRSSQGEIFIDTFGGGSLNGVQVYNNTVSANAPLPGGVLHVHAAQLNGTLPNVFENNLLYSAGPLMMDSVGGFFNIHNNLYWYTGSGSPTWTYAGQTYTSLSAFQSGSRQGAHDLNANPLLTDPLYTAVGAPLTSFQLSSGSPAIGAGAATSGVTTDFFGNPIPTSGPYNIGAYQLSGSFSPCDLNKSGSTNVLDVQLASNQVIGTTTCGSADIDGNGSCTVTDIQRIINAALGMACTTSP